MVKVCDIVSLIIFKECFVLIYRIENQKTNNGMWYKSNGEYAPFILNLTEGISKHLPMGFNPEHKEGGMDWCSAGISKEQMNLWFSARDALELYQSGYRLFEFEVENFKKKDFEVLFTRDSIIGQIELPLVAIWDINLLK